MALYDRRTLEGVYSVRQSVIYIQNYRYAEERMMRMMAGWIALTPELAVKLDQREVSGGNTAHQGEHYPSAHVLLRVEVSPRGLGRMADPSPHVQLPCCVHVQPESVVGEVLRGFYRNECFLPRGERAITDLWIQVGARDTHLRARFVDPGHRNLQVVIVGERGLDKIP